eukprot:scaffold175188_cov18-Tisochrysis_lutea.AAC.1
MPGAAMGTGSSSSTLGGLVPSTGSEYLRPQAPLGAGRTVGMGGVTDEAPFEFRLSGSVPASASGYPGFVGGVPGYRGGGALGSSPADSKGDGSMGLGFRPVGARAWAGPDRFDPTYVDSMLRLSRELTPASGDMREHAGPQRISGQQKDELPEGTALRRSAGDNGAHSLANGGQPKGLG